MRPSASERRWVLRAALALGLGTALVSPGLADGVAYRVADLRTAPLPPGNFSSEGFAPVGAGFFLPAWWPGVGCEPYSSSGAAQDLTLLRNIGPGGWSSCRETLGRLGDLVLFLAWEPATGTEIWRTDGTAAGTWPVSDLVPGRGGSWAATLGVLGGVMLVAAYDEEHGSELWRTDGTTAGTWLVADLAPGPLSGLYGGNVPGNQLGGKVFFGARDATQRPQLWASDGTLAGTEQLSAVDPELGGLEVNWIVSGEGRVFFAGRDGEHGEELWTSDGTPAGTGLVADLRPGPDESYPVPWGPLGDRFLFAARDATGFDRYLWATDGTPSGTERLSAVRLWREEANLGESGRVGERIVFAAEGPSGREPWVTDGTSAGTHLLADLMVGEEDSLWGWGPARGHDGLYFCAVDAAYDTFLWRTEGTEAGTVAVVPLPACEDIVESATRSGVTLLSLHWWSFCGPHHECEYYELWRTDGTAGGSVPFWPDLPGLSPSGPHPIVAREGGVVFGVYTGPPVPSYERRLWRSDGTLAGTAEMTTPSGAGVELWSEMALLPDGELAFVGHGLDDSFESLWRTDGELLASLGGGGSPFGAPEAVARAGDSVYFSAHEGETALLGLWRTDGTPAGTLPIETLGDAGGFQGLGELADVFGRLWFAGSTTAWGSELWESEGTGATTRAHDFTPGPDPASTHPEGITALDPLAGTLVFRTREDGGLDSLWSFTPGSAERVFLKTIPSRFYGFVAPQAVLDGTLYFFDLDPAGRRELWRSDGTALGTELVTVLGFDWPEGSVPTVGWELVAFGGALYFPSCEVASGCEPWTSDGTAAGTRRFADLEPGPGSSLPTQLTPIRDRLYFSACRAAKGCEPWVSDGTPAGTHRVGDVAPGLAASGSHRFTRSGDLVYFAADDTTGEELWAMPVELFYDGFETGDLTRWSGVGEP